MVEALVARSLVRRLGEAGGEARFGMLETIREYGLEMVATHQETAALCERHLQWCAQLVERTIPAVSGPEQSASLDRLEAEHDNVRAALLWADQTGDSSGLGLRIASQLGLNFWTIRGYHREGRAWLTRLLARVPARSSARAIALRSLGNLALRQNDYPAASAGLGEAAEIFRELGDRRGVAETLRHLGVVPHHLGQLDAAQAILEESVAISRELGDLSTLGIALRNLADLAQDRRDSTRSVALYNEVLTIARERQIPHDIAYALRGLGNVARAQGQYDRAEQHLRESLALLKPLRDRRCIPLSLEGLACITVGPGWAERAARLLSAAHAMQAQTGAPSPPSTQADYQRTVADARQVLGLERFDAAWAAGAALSLDAAIDLALAARSLDDPADASSAGTSPAASHAAVPLTPREREVVALIAQGHSNRQISERLVLSVRTVERHIENVYNRLGISGKAGRAIVTAYALRHQLVGERG
jgi:non-specific serine/threonine protein kinase